MLLIKLLLSAVKMYNDGMNTEKFGEFIKEQRTGLKFTREAFAALLGMSASYLNNIERGIQVPSPELIIEIARHLNVRSGYLFQFLDDTSKAENSVNVPSGLTPQERLQVEQYAKFLLSQAQPMENFIQRSGRVGRLSEEPESTPSLITTSTVGEGKSNALSHLVQGSKTKTVYLTDVRQITNPEEQPTSDQDIADTLDSLPLDESKATPPMKRPKSKRQIKA